MTDVFVKLLMTYKYQYKLFTLSIQTFT